MANHSLEPAAPGQQLFCPLLQHMRNHSSSTRANTGLICIHGLVSGIGILENALILWVVGFRLRRRTVASVWVLNLALSDLLATLTLPLFTFYLKSSNSWELGNPLCKIQASIFFLNMFVSAFLLAAISLDRCLLVSKPVWSQNHRSVAAAWRLCGLGWLWAAANTFPYFFFRSVTEKSDGRKFCYHDFALYWSSLSGLHAHCQLWQAGTAVSKLLLAFLIPLGIIAASYIQISLVLKSRHKRRRQSTGRSAAALVSGRAEAASQNKKPFFRCRSSSPSPTPSQSSHLSQSFTKMVTLVVAVFAACWAPYHIVCMIEVAAEYRRQYLRLVETWLQIATTAAFLNPVLNPVLYVFSCPNFCLRIQQSLGAVFDALVEEGGGRLHKGSKTHMWRKSSQDATPETLGPKALVSLDGTKQEVNAEAAGL